MKAYNDVFDSLTGRKCSAAEISRANRVEFMNESCIRTINIKISKVYVIAICNWIKSVCSLAIHLVPKSSSLTKFPNLCGSLVLSLDISCIVNCIFLYSVSE